MTRGKYLDELTQHLRSLSDGQIREIVAEIYAHFEEGLASGLNEDAIAEGLGAPKDVAREYLKLYEGEASAERERGFSPLRMFGEEPYREEWDLPLGANERLRAEIANIEMVVTATDVETLQAEFDGSRVADSNGLPRIKIEREGNGVAIVEEHPNDHGGGWIARILSNVPRLRGKLTVRIPKKIGPMHVDLRSGAVSVEGANVDAFESDVRSGSLSMENIVSGGKIGMEVRSGMQKVERVRGEKIDIAVRSGMARVRELSGASLKAEVSSGKLEARGVIAKEGADMSVKSGMIQAHEIEAGKVRLEVRSGSASVQGLQTEAVYADVSSGSIKMELTNTADAELTASSGSVAMSMPRGEGFTYETEASSGSVAIRFDDKREDGSGKGKGRKQGTVGGGGRKVKAKALSGSVQVRER